MSTSIKTAFCTYLLSIPSVTAAVALDEDQRPAIYYGRGLQDSTADPYISVHCPHYDEEQEIGGPPVIGNADMSVCCLSKIPDTAQLVAETVISAFRYLVSPPLSMGGLRVLGTWVKETRDEQINDYGLFEVAVDIGVQFELD